MRRLLLLAGAALAAAGCGGSSTTNVDLTYTRADGSRVVVKGPVNTVCDRGLLTVTVGYRTGTRPKTYWMLAVAAEAKPGRVRVPASFHEDPPARGLILFLYDRADRENELSTNEEEAHGSIDLREFSCADRRIRATVHATLGSEFSDLPEVTADGTIDVS
jgi:hypothetical protein